MRVVRVYHAGRDRAHRARERALSKAGIDLTLVVPARWPERGSETRLSYEAFEIVELDTDRTGDVNRHAYRADLDEVLARIEPDVLDIHEEPVSVAARQWLAASPARLPVVMYTAQNIDKRFPPPFHGYERAAHRRIAALYPCSRQAAGVARGKGFEGTITVLPLGYDADAFRAGSQSLHADEIVLVLAGRLVEEKGTHDAVHVLAQLNATRPARLVFAGRGPVESSARQLAASLGVDGRVEFRSWQTAAALADLLRTAHVVLVPSHPTPTWVEQFGRVIVEAQASGAVVAGYTSGAIPEVAGDAGLLVPPGDVSALAAAVAQVIVDPREFERRRATGIALASVRTWQQVAERQTALYRKVLERADDRVVLPRSPRRRRELARAEFGPTAATQAGMRPFALPTLRRGGAAAAALAAVVDAGAEIKACLSR
jgi:glycosyltransferase involved in cell wall biosynthesis